MQLEGFNICQQVAEKNNLDYDVVKSINDAFFSKLATTVREVPSLIITLPQIGHFYYRRKKVRSRLEGGKFEEDFGKKLENILDMYDGYREDHLNYKYEKFGKESHDAYLLVKKEEKLSRTKKADDEKHTKLRKGGV